MTGLFVSVKNAISQAVTDLKALYAASSGASLVGGTWFGGVVETVAALATSLGSSLLGFIQAGAGAVLRSIESKLRERVSVLDFGADPTGATESTTAFQNAINSLSANGGTVFVPPGTYVVGTLDFPNDPKVVNLVGAGKYATILKMATAAGPMIRKVPTAGRIVGALFSDFTIKAHANSDKTNLAHKAMLLTGWSNSHFKRIAYKSNGTAPGSGSVGIFIDLAAHPYLSYQNTFEGIDCSVNYGPSRVFHLNNNGQTVFENPNIVEIRDSWFYALGGCNVIIDGANCTRLSVRNNIFEDCPGATGVSLSQNTLVEGNWFELLATNIATQSTASTDGSSSVVLNNYFSGAGTSFIDTISVKPLWIGNGGGGQTVTGAGVTRIDAVGATPAAPALTGGDGVLTELSRTVNHSRDLVGNITYQLSYTNTPASVGFKKFVIGSVAGYTVASLTVGAIRGANGDPKAWGGSIPANEFWVAFTTTDEHSINVLVTLKAL